MARTPEQPLTPDEVAQANKLLLEGYCGMATAYLAERVRRLEDDLEAEKRRRRVLDEKVYQLEERMAKAAEKYTALNRKVEKFETLAPQPQVAAKAS